VRRRAGPEGPIAPERMALPPANAAPADTNCGINDDGWTDFRDMHSLVLRLAL
jgi:hypothetical protein